MSVSTVRPAMTPEEWAEKLALTIGGSPLWALHQGHSDHAIAAICLHGHPFGFTREDVSLLRTEAKKAIGAPSGRPGRPTVAYAFGSRGSPYQRLEDLADRIEALLPPEKE